MRLRSSLVWLENIKDITMVEMSLDGDTHAMTFDVTDDDDTSTITLDGDEIPLTNGKRLYTRVLSITIDGIDAESTYGSAKHTITITKRDGSKRVMRLLPINERQYLIELDGKNDRFYTGITNINSLLDAIDVVLSGGTLSAS